LSFVAGNLSAQFVPYAAWEYLNPVPQAATLLSVKMIDSNTYIAVGDGGTIVRTFDDGKTWKVDAQVLGEYLAFTSVDFGSPSTGIIATRTKILFTNDTGNTWTSTQIEGTVGLVAVYYASPSRAFCVGKRGEVHLSFDSGKSWLTLHIDIADPLQDIHFLTPDIGIIGASSGTLYMTTDSGKSWSKQPKSLPGSASSISFADPLHGVICGTASISLTSDGGLTWERANVLPKGNANDAIMLSPSRILVVCEWREAFLSEDSGKSWKNVEPYSAWKFRSVSFLDDKRNGVIVGNSGVIMRTRDGGRSWVGETEKIADDMYGLQAVWCFDSLTAVACGNVGTLIRTTDGGRKWTIIENDVYADLFDIHFQTPLVGTIVGGMGTILRTRDGGISWVHQNSYAPDDDLRHVSFLDTSNGIACGLHGLLRMTANGGRSWIPITSMDDSLDLADIAYISESTVIVTGSHLLFDSTAKPPDLFKDSYLFRSTNRGVNWDTILYRRGQGAELRSLAFVSQRTGYCVYNAHDFYQASILGSTVFKTTDGGLSWNPTPAKAKLLGYDMSFVNEHSGTIVGSQGETAHTFDGGETWADVRSGTTLTLRGVSHGSLNGAFAVGVKTAILRLVTNDTLVTLSTPVSAASQNELLRGIYPNPAHTTVTIEFALDEPTTASLIIYNVEGKRMGMTSDARYEKGIHTLEYDVSNFPSGFYFAEITTEGRREMMKFIVQ